MLAEIGYVDTKRCLPVEADVCSGSNRSQYCPVSYEERVMASVPT